MSSQPDRRADLWALFAVTWAAAVLFHLGGNPRLAPEWGRAVLGVAAIAVIARPRRTWLAVPLAVAVLVNVWLEAPILGNHWLLHGFLAVLVLGVVVAAWGSASASIGLLAGPARLTLLAFYGFAAFAKLNGDFFEPVASCSVFYLRESADSWGAIGAIDALPNVWERVAPFVVAGIELTVPVLLLLRRTRRAGVVLGLCFHFVLALDRTHQFFDFSSVLTVFFLLFLAEEDRHLLVQQFRRAAGALRRRWASGPELVGLLGLALLVGGVAFASGPSEWPAVRELRVVGVWIWIAVGLVVIGAVVRAVRSSPFEAEPVTVGLGSRWWLVVPALAVFNGLTPYLELKSGFGWNMYSNLAVVDGESNHLVVRRGLPLTDGYDRLVQIESTMDRRLRFYVREPWLVPERQLVEYLADRPGVIVRGEVDGQTVRYEGGSGGRLPTWQRKFQVFRAVDAEGPTNCQPSFGPAR